MSRKLCQALPLGLLLAVALLFTPNVLSLLGSDTYTLTIEAVGSGTTSPPPGVYTYTSGQEVTVEAIPDEGYIFYQWELDGQRLDPHGPSTIRLYVDRDRVLKAIFIPKEPSDGYDAGGSNICTLTIYVVGNGSTNPPEGTYTYLQGDIALIKAIPDEGYIFYQWELDGQRLGRGSPLIEVEVNKNHVLRALFVKKELVEPLKGTQSPGEGDTGIDIKSGVSAERGWNLTSNLSLVA